MSNTFLPLVERAFDLSQKPFRPRPKTKEVSTNGIKIHIIAYYTTSKTTSGRDSLSVVYIYGQPITGFFNTQSTYFRTRQSEGKRLRVKAVFALAFTLLSIDNQSISNSGEARKRLSAEKYHPINLFPNPKVGHPFGGQAFHRPPDHRASGSTYHTSSR